MEHDPTNEFPDSFSPSARSDEPLDETVEMLETAPHAATVPVPPPVPSAVAAPMVPPASSGLPMAAEPSVVPAPPPPPASSYSLSNGYPEPSGPASPPVSRVIGPPMSSSPPQPGREFGSGPSTFGTTGVDPVVVAPAPPRRWPWAVGGFLAAALLALAGFAAGLALQDDSSNVTATPSAGQVVPAAQSNSDEDPVVEDVPGPLSGDESAEPVAAVAEALSPSVVTITNDIGQGSGIVWDSSNGYILTNDHVVGDSPDVTVVFPDGNAVPGQVVGNDEARDIAVVQVDSATSELVDAVFAPTSSVSVGQLAVAIGSPFSLDQTVTSGVVSAVNRVNPDGGSNPLVPVPVAMIQTDAPINPGNSGERWLIVRVG